MARVGQRIAVATVSALLLFILVQCNALKQKVGDKCVNNGKFTCADGQNALLCQTGTLVSMPCRGPKGCTGMGPASQCDDDFGMVGEVCMVDSTGENYACQTDMKAQLACVNGKWAVNSTCKGPGACKVVGLMVNCDDNFADVGDPCKSNASDANYSCTPDKKDMVVCTNNKFVKAKECHGPKGCHIEGNEVYCN
jgi:hypothetical protein